MTKLNQILIVALVLQGALIAALNMGGEKKQSGKAEKLFPSFDAGKVTEIKVLGEMGGARPQTAEVVVSKDGSKWVIRGADNYPADESKVTSFLESVGKLTARGAVATKAAYHAKLEVGDERYQRKVVLKHDGQEIGFLVGTTPSFKSVHLRKLGGDEVVVANGLSAWDIGTNEKGWVNPTYLDIKKEDVWALRIDQPGKSLALERGPGDVWAVLGADKPAKSTEIDNLIRKAGSVSLEKPIGRTAKPEYGLSSPLATVTLTTGTSTIAGMPPREVKQERLIIGQKTSIDEVEQYYVQHEGSPYIVTAPAWALSTLLEKTAKDLVEE